METLWLMYDNIKDTVYDLIENLDNIAKTLTDPLSQVLSEGMFGERPILNAVIKFILETLNLGNTNIINLVFGSAIQVIIIIAVIKLFSDIIT